METERTILPREERATYVVANTPMDLNFDDTIDKDTEDLDTEHPQVYICPNCLRIYNGHPESCYTPECNVKGEDFFTCDIKLSGIIRHLNKYHLYTEFSCQGDGVRKYTDDDGSTVIGIVGPYVQFKPLPLDKTMHIMNHTIFKSYQDKKAGIHDVIIERLDGNMYKVHVSMASNMVNKLIEIGNEKPDKAQEYYESLFQIWKSELFEL